MLSRRINEAAMEYWQRTGYSASDLEGVCADIENLVMAARVNFSGGGQVSMQLSQKTWERREGHYPVIANYFLELARHPALQDISGSLLVWLEDGLWEPLQVYSRRAPVLAFGRHQLDHQTFLMPDPAFIGDAGYSKHKGELDALRIAIPWEGRKPSVFWRGAATGLGIEEADWVRTARGRLTLLAQQINDPSLLDAKITKVAHLSPEQQQIMLQAGVVGEPVPFNQFLTYRYVVDADGYCCAWQSLFLKLASGSAVVKIQSPYEQWYFDSMRPWKHYLPLYPDLKDFKELSGWLRAHDDEAQKIAANARNLVDHVSYDRSFETVALTCRHILECSAEWRAGRGTLSSQRVDGRGQMNLDSGARII